MKVIASLALKAAYLELVPAFERASGEPLDTQWVGMADIRKRILAGEAADVVIGSAALIEELVGAARLDAASRVELARSGVGAAVRAGARKPDLATVESLKSALRAAQSIVYSSGPSGVYLAQLFQRLGLAETLAAKATQAPPGVLVGELVARGEFELCFQQVPELRQVAGIEYAGPLPDEVQCVTLFTGAVHAGSMRAAQGGAWLRSLASPQAAPVMAKHGLQPAY